MKTRITLIAENDKSIPNGYTKEDMEKAIRLIWEIIAEGLMEMSGGERCYIEKAELIEE